MAKEGLSRYVSQWYNGASGLRLSLVAQDIAVKGACISLGLHIP